ncbi:hypothetical protein VSU16_14815 (plasmid) [Cetobacterium somerae]|uniref:hypothetical protein n=1 Tax=Cetobacterium somerae TaxID=188913 RepID=UPI002E7B77A5|nr:hypothetical protein [Cetobacterium somerae]WVJ03000.1 hypothetical protein VSU16_14815 [Cetobacterium somerae]
MRNILNDFEFSSYTTSKELFLNKLFEKRPQDNLDLTPRNTDCLFNVLIEELDKDKKNNIFFTGKQLKAMHSDVKNGIFVFRGVILETDKETLNLIKETSKGKTFNQFIKKIKITKAKMKNEDEVEVLREYSFKGFVSEFVEYYDDKNNYIFEFVICRRKILYRDDIIIKRLPNGILAIATILEPAKITIPAPKKSKLKKLQVGNTFWAVSGIALATLGIAGAVATGGVAAIAVTFVYGANTIFSGSYSIYLDYNDRDSEMDLDTLYNNPLKFSFGEIFVKARGENSRNIGHAMYYGSEVFLGVKGLNQFVKGFKVKSILENIKVNLKHPSLGNLEGMEKVISGEKLIFNIFQLIDGTKGVYNNSVDFKSATEEIIKPKFNPVHSLN